MKKALVNALIMAQPFMAAWGLGADLSSLQAALVPPAERAAYLPRETLRIDVEGADLLQLDAGLSIEVDAIDVTAMVRFDAGALTFTPVKPLSAGPHELRLVAYGTDGSVTELGYWTFTVREQGFFRNASLTGHVDMTLARRLAESEALAGQDAFNAQGSASFQAAGNTPAGQWTGSMDLLYVHREAQSPTGNRLDVGTFVARAEGKYLDATVGHQTVAEQGLLFDGYQKRGIALSGNWQAARSKLTVFGMSAQELTGADDALGLSDGDNRYHGGLLQTRLWQSASYEAHLSGAYLSGNRARAGYGNWNQEVPVSTGSGWNLALDNYWFARQLRLRFEGAATNSRASGETEDRSDSAYSALLVVSPQWDTVQWQLGAEAKEIGPDFHSLANPYLPVDRRSERLFSQLAAGQWSLNASVGEERDNVDSDPARSRTATEVIQLAVNYSDFAAAEPGSLKAWLGTPSYGLNLQRTRLEDRYTAAGVNPQDILSESAALNAAFAATHWQWSLGYSYQSFDDYTDQQMDSRIHSLFANASFRLGQWASLQPGWQRQRTENLDYSAVFYATHYNLAGEFTLVPDRLGARISVNHSANEALNDPFYVQDNRSESLSGQLTWHALRAKPNRLGLDISLSVSTQDYYDRLFGENSNDSYQVFLTLRTTLPTQLPGGVQ